MSTVLVTWKGKKFEVPILDQQGQPAFHKESLRSLYDRCSASTGVPVERMKLLMAGGEMPKTARSSTSGYRYDAYGNATPGTNNDDFMQNIGESFKTVGKKIDKAMDGFFSWMEGKDDSTRDSPPSGSYVMMKDLNAPLAHYGIKPGSKIMMIGDAAPAEPQPRTSGFSTPTPQQQYSPSMNPTSNSTKPLPTPPPSQHQETVHLTPDALALQKLSSIRHELEGKVNPLIDSYTTSVIEFTSAIEASREPTQTLKQLKDSHAKVSELLLQGLLKIDGVVVPEGHEEVRLRRKEAVKFVNGLLEKVDGLKERVAEASKYLVTSGGNGTSSL
ncbi:hypothetical protein HDU76_008720 [Blyttiomyces sp. JEL0837]|nr:hypothetical protein HDU76_008720 [Blyttiomyces sp. JEL0837]